MRYVWLMAAAAVLWLSTGLPPVDAEGPGKRGQAALRRLAAASGGALEARWHDDLGTPALLKGRLTRPSRHTPVWIAYEFLSEARQLYGIRQPRRDLRVQSVEATEHGGYRVVLQQWLYHTPVWGDELCVDVDREGIVRQVSGRIHPELRRQTMNRAKHAAVSAKRATAAALSDLARAGVSAAGEPVVRLYYLPVRPGVPLVYAVTATDEAQRSHTRLVHAHTGRIVPADPATPSTSR